MLVVERGTPAHAFELAFNLRQEDKYEVAIVGHDPLTALINPFRYTRDNVNTYTVLDLDGNVKSMFGVVSQRNNIKHGSVWFLSTELSKKEWLYFLKRNRKWTQYFLSDYEYVANMVPKSNKRTIKWLKWQDFSFKDKEIIVNGIEMLYFYKKIPSVSNGIQPVLGDIGPHWTTEIS
tara:strand:- start:3549 stop:4079 length:531 start_codon:yes stop_codon:yes gene_type:complete